MNQKRAINYRAISMAKKGTKPNPLDRLTSNFLLPCVVALVVTAFQTTCTGAGTYDYAGKHLYSGQRSNNWNSAVSWTNGPAEFPNAPGDVARTASFINGDVDLYLNQDITIGTFDWRGTVLCVYGGTPQGRFIVDNFGQPSVWQMEITGWFRWYCDVVLSNELRLIVTNSTGFGERAVPSVLVGGVFSGPGKLILEAHTPSLNACELGINWQARNTHSGGTRLVSVPWGRIYFIPMKQGFFGTGPVELGPFTRLVLRNLAKTNDFIADSAALYLETLDATNHAHVFIEAGVTEKVARLYIDGVQMPAGVYGATGSGATEVFDEFFSGTGVLVVTNGPPSPGVIRNLPAAAVSPTRAVIGCELLATNASPTAVYIYWGPTDGAMHRDAWANQTYLGERGIGPFYLEITNYNPGQTVFYRSYLTNALGGCWAGSTARLCPPLVQNELPFIGSNYVTLRGSVLTTGGPPTVLTVYCGRTDAGTNATAWEHATVLGVTSGGLLGTNIVGLLPDTVYYYRTYGTNIAGESWASSSATFKTTTTTQWGDIVFFVASDLHYGAAGHVPAANELSRQTIENMNALPGQPWPANLGGGFVSQPRGVLLVGDLTDGRTDEQWAAFTNDWGLNGERLLTFPVYEGFGNHDASSSTYGLVPNGIKTRNQHRPGLRNISANGYHYSFDWDFLHVVCLNVFPGDELDPGYSGPNPSNSMQFLEMDLATFVGKSGRPVVIYHHYGFDSYGLSGWSDRQRSNYFNVISNYNVICIFNGHSHVVSFFPWRGITTCIDGTVGKFHGNFVLARVTQTNLVLVERTISNTWGKTFTKTISVPSGLAVSNEEGATDVTSTSARLNGRFVMTGPPPVQINIYWGRTDGGTNNHAWESVIPLGALELGPFSTVVTGLWGGTTYYYRCCASNSFGQAWAPTSAQFMTLAPNTAPVLEPVPDQFVDAGEMLVLTNIATDAESPPQTLTFQLVTGPPGALLTSDTGVFGWRPAPSHIFTTNMVIIKVSDNGNPVLSATQSFNIIVLPPTHPLITDVTMTNDTWTMKIWSGLSAEHAVEYSTNLSDWIRLFATIGPLLPLHWSDSNLATYPVRFYRVRCVR